MAATLTQLELGFDHAAALAEARRFHSHPDDSHFPFLSWNWREIDSVRLQQQAVPVAVLPQLLRNIQHRKNWQHEHHFIVQNEFKAPNRRALNLWSFGLAWADLDLHSASHDARTVDHWTKRLLNDCAELGLPEPSIIVWSGRGLHAKWTLTRPLPAQALARWAAVMRAIADKLASLGWPVDGQAKDVSRVLRIAGTMNPKPDEHGQVVLRLVYITHEGPDYDFDVLCEWVLPYTREQVRQFREDDAARKEADAARRAAWAEAGKTYAEYEENRRRAQELLGRTLAGAVAAAGEAEQALHWLRLEVIRAAAAGRGGISQGQRNEWLWIAANSLAWGLGDAGKLWYELPQLAQEIAPTLSWAEAQSSASSVHLRLKQGGRDALYRMKTDTLIERLGLTPEEARPLRGAGHGTKNEGAMNLPKLRNLPFDVWQEKVRERMRAGGAYSASIRSPEASARGPQAKALANADKRATARHLRQAGTTIEAIAEMLGVSVGTVWNWTK